MFAAIMIARGSFSFFQFLNGDLESSPSTSAGETLTRGLREEDEDEEDSPGASTPSTFSGLSQYSPVSLSAKVLSPTRAQENAQRVNSAGEKLAGTNGSRKKDEVEHGSAEEEEEWDVCPLEG